MAHYDSRIHRREELKAASPFEEHWEPSLGVQCLLQNITSTVSNNIYEIDLLG
jgi:hypothetical protein